MLRTTQHGVPSLKGYISNSTPTAEFQGTSQRREQEDYKIQRTRKSVVRLCLLEMTGMLHP